MALLRTAPPVTSLWFAPEGALSVRAPAQFPPGNTTPPISGQSLLMRTGLSVVFFKPIGEDNEHPGYATVASGEQHTADLIKMIERSPLWKDSVIVVTYDENGGLWDHVAPPKTDKWGPGTRVPTLIISPYAKKGFVDHTVYDTTSILKLIETRHHLEPLGSRDAGVADLTNALDLH